MFHNYEPYFERSVSDFARSVAIVRAFVSDLSGFVTTWLIGSVCIQELNPSEEKPTGLEGLTPHLSSLNSIFSANALEFSHRIEGMEVMHDARTQAQVKTLKEGRYFAHHPFIGKQTIKNNLFLIDLKIVGAS